MSKHPRPNNHRQQKQPGRVAGLENLEQRHSTGQSVGIGNLLPAKPQTVETHGLRYKVFPIHNARSVRPSIPAERQCKSGR